MTEGGAATATVASVIERVLRVLATLVQVHVEHARLEARRDRARVIRAVLVMALGAALFAMMLTLLHIAAVCTLHDHHVGWVRAVLMVAVADLALSAGLMQRGRRALRAPILGETRALLRKTVQSVTDA